MASHKLLAGTASAVFAACTTGGHLARLPDAREIRAGAPAPYHVVLAPLELADDVQLATTEGLGLRSDVVQLRAALLTYLEELRAASVVGAVDGDVLDAAAVAGADLLLQPRLVATEFAYASANTDGFVSTLLWLVTWAGGLFVSDSDYDARLRIDWQVVNPVSGQVLATLPGSMRSYPLRWLERNELLSWPGLQTLVMPPLLTSDDPELTSERLTELAIGNAACDVARFLKQRMGGEERELCGELRLEAPQNNDEVSATCRLRGGFVANDLVTRIDLVVNGEIIGRWDADALPDRTEQQVGARTYRVPLPDAELHMRPGRNTVALTFVSGGRRSSRTLVLNASLNGARP